MRALILLTLVACDQVEPATAPKAADAPASADKAVLVARLSARHQEAGCADLVRDLADPRLALREVVETVPYPAWAGLLAGRCLAELYPTEEEATLRVWAQDPARRGLRRTLERTLSTAEPQLAARILCPADPSNPGTFRCEPATPPPAKTNGLMENRPATH